MPVKITQLQEYSCFRELTEDQLAAIGQLANVVVYSSGHTLFEDGKSGDFIYLLTNGEVEVLYSIGEGGPIQVDRIYAKELIGCSVLIPPYTYTATTRSLTKIEVLQIDAEALRKLMKEHCQLGFAIQKQIMQMLMDRIISLRLGV